MPVRLLPLIATALLAAGPGDPPPDCTDCADIAVIEQAGLAYATTGSEPQVALAERINGLVDDGAATLVGHPGDIAAGLSPTDAWRVARHLAYVTTALVGFHQTRPGAAGLDTVLGLIGAPRLAVQPPALAGDWQCRKLRIDGAAATVTTFRWFACRITPQPGGLRLDKISGSDRLAAQVAWAGDAGVLAGCEGRTPCRYGDDPARNRAGVLAFDTPDHGALLRVEGPRSFEILELRR